MLLALQIRGVVAVLQTSAYESLETVLRRLLAMDRFPLSQALEDSMCKSEN